MSLKTQPTTGNPSNALASNVFALHRSKPVHSATRQHFNADHHHHAPAVAFIRDAREAREFGTHAGIGAELLQRAVARLGKPKLRALRTMAQHLVGAGVPDPSDLLRRIGHAAGVPLIWLAVAHAYIEHFEASRGPKGGAA